VCRLGLPPPSAACRERATAVPRTAGPAKVRWVVGGVVNTVCIQRRYMYAHACMSTGPKVCPSAGTQSQAPGPTGMPSPKRRGPQVCPVDVA
jgi:hypothetical protein